VTVWVDAQLPPQLASWLAATFGLDAQALVNLGLRDANDIDIFQGRRGRTDQQGLRLRRTRVAFRSAAAAVVGNLRERHERASTRRCSGAHALSSMRAAPSSRLVTDPDDCFPVTRSHPVRFSDAEGVLVDERRSSPFRKRR
jgi:hypothetical protein